MIEGNINDFLNDKSKLITETYFELQKHYEKKYGFNSIVLIEIGTFFEVYEINNATTQIGKAKEIAEILNIQLTRKNKNILENDVKNPLMAGVPTISLQKHLDKLIEQNKYTIILVKQKGNPPKVTRYIDSIISPGTNFEFIKSDDSNYITSIIFDKNSDIYSVGYSTIELTTGKTHLFETHGTKEDREFALDAIFNLLHTHKTHELILTFLDSTINIKEILTYLDIEDNYSYHINYEKLKIDYQNELFRKVYQIKSLLSPIEYLDLERYLLISESLANLIEFIISHDYSIIEKLNKPEIIDDKKYLYIGNNALEQLNVVSSEAGENSLLKLISNTSTPIGKRLLKERLLNPIIEKKEILRRYSLSKKLHEIYDILDIELKNIYDIERINRRIKLKKLNPFEINYLISSLFSIKEISKIVEEKKLNITSYNPLLLEEFIEELKLNFDLDISAKYLLGDISENIFKDGVNPRLDALVNENKNLHEKIELFANKFDSLIHQASNKDGKYCTIEELNADGHYINITKNRYMLIKDIILNEMIVIDDSVHLLKNATYKIQTTNVKITNEYIDELSSRIMANRQKIASITKEVFLEKMGEYEFKYSTLLEQLILFISEIDVSVSNIKTAIKYNYSEPVIVDVDEEENFLEITALRHPLIETREEIGIYVPNDIVIGDKKYISKKLSSNVIVENMGSEKLNGILLYGINSSGKSSLMKSIGMAVILAQAGFYVPASKFRFSIFESLFTRIVGRDDMSKGLSTFAVEMIELKNIFNRSNSKSLVLGDEISHGTETLSAVSIVASSILKLSRLNALFVFATHLHQLNDIKEIKALNNIINLHLAVEYDEQSDKLTFDRNLSYGSGSSVYGLEFAKSLHMDREFLDVANQIRKTIADDFGELEEITKRRKSKYNKNLYISKCSICGESVDDVHHIKEKSNASLSGHIDHFRKDHKYNLIPLCKKHHNMVHSGELIINGFVATDKGLELHYHIKK